MLEDKILKSILLLIIINLFSGCATTMGTLPEEWLPSPGESQQEAFGGWIEVKFRADNNVKIAAGELIAVQEDKIYLITDNKMVIIPIENVIKATVAFYDTGADTGYALIFWTIIGTISTLSHGWFSLYTAPAWIVSGISITAWEFASMRGQIEYPGSEWKEFRKYARFPQGLPEGIDLNSLKPKQFNRTKHFVKPIKKKPAVKHQEKDSLPVSPF